MSKKLLSISIASYNAERTLGEAVHSLLIDKRWMDKLEIIIVNDGSKDSTSDIAHNLEQQFPESIIVIDKENGGYGSTINSSLSIARGKYYKLLDGDDWFSTEKLPAFLDYLDKTDADLIISPYVEVRGRVEKIVDNHQEISGNSEYLEGVKITNGFFAMHEIAVKTEIIRSFGRQIAEKCFYTDSEFVFYCLIGAMTISRFRNPIYRYRMGIDGQSVSIQGIRKHYQDLKMVSNRIIKVYNTEVLATKGAKQVSLNYCVQNIVFHTFQAYMLLEKPLRFKKELMTYDKDIKKESLIAYEIGNKSNLVKMTRRLKFRLYSILCIIVSIKFWKENRIKGV